MAPGIVRAPGWVKKALRRLHPRRHALRKRRMPGAEQGPDRKTAGLLSWRVALKGSGIAIQPLRPLRVEASRTGNHVPRWERRSPSLHEGELPCVQTKQRACSGRSACCWAGPGAPALRSRRHRDWLHCCVRPLLRAQRERAFVGESLGPSAKRSLDGAAMRRPAADRCRFVGKPSNQGSPSPPLGWRCALRSRRPRAC